jgi:hypothetical protein
LTYPCMPLAWVPPSPRVRCHLACVYLLTTLLDFDDTNESQSGPIKINYPPGRRADREVSSYRRTRRALSPRSRAYPADRPRVRSIGLIGQRTTAKRCLCPIKRNPKRARVSTTTARVYRKVRKFAFGDRWITAGPKLPRYARTVRTQGFSVPPT